MREGKYFNADAPETMVEYAGELQEYIIEPLIKIGFTRVEALVVHLTFQFRHLRYDVQELGTYEAEDWEK